MRRLILTLVILLSCGRAGAQVYFCSTPSSSCRYVRSECKNGEVKWVHTLTIDSVTVLDDGFREVCYHSSFKDDKGKEITDGDISLSAVIDRDGNVGITLSDAITSVIHSFMPNSKVTSDGGRTILPSGMIPGDVLPDAFASATAGVIKYTVAVSDRHVLRRESLTTPAGTFECVVLSEHKEEKAGPYNRVTNALTWYSPGVGMVRHDTYDKNMKLETSEVLCEYTH